MASVCLVYQHILKFHGACNVCVIFEGAEGEEGDYGHHRVGSTSSLVLLSCAINGVVRGRNRRAVVISVKKKEVRSGELTEKWQKSEESVRKEEMEENRNERAFSKIDYLLRKAHDLAAVDEGKKEDAEKSFRGSSLLPSKDELEAVVFAKECLSEKEFSNMRG